MTDTLGIVRSLVGRRHKITADEMVAILLALPIDLAAASTITGRNAEGRLYVGGEWIANPADERRATARAWERMCRGITCISVLTTSYYRGDDSPSMLGLGVRYDEPGSMHPRQHAELLFAPAALEGYEDDQIGQMRRHCDRLLIVQPGKADERGAEFRSASSTDTTQANLR